MTHFMPIYNIMAIIISLAVVVGYVNHRFIKLQPTTAMMVGALLISFLLIILGQFGFDDLEKQIADSLSKINFYDLLMNGMLSFLLFAGGLTINLNNLKQRKWEIATLSFGSTLASTFLIGFIIFTIFRFFHIDLPLIFCLLFGALISPTDPIATLAVFKKIQVPKPLQTCVAGEALFNDGIGIVLFLTIYHIADTGHAATWQGVLTLFFREAMGGIVFGGMLGLIAYRLIKPLDDYLMAILITLGITTGGYALAQMIDISGPLAMVVAGILIGNKGEYFNTESNIRKHMLHFWELIDEILNAVLFLFIGLELLVLPRAHHEFLASIIAIPLVLLIRFVTVGVPMVIFKKYKSYEPHVIKILTWGGLRGGLAVALALALPNGEPRDLILMMTYSIVGFSIIIQGLSIKSLAELTKQ